MFHNDSNYDYHFIIKELAEEIKGQCDCLGKTQKYVTYSLLIKKENSKTIKCKIKFINSVRFMASSLSSLADSLAEGLQKDKVKIVSLILNTCHSMMAH